jgi:alpha-glucosidase
MLSRLLKFSAVALRCLKSVKGTLTNPAVLDACPGYNVVNVKSRGAQLTADLVLAGGACNVYGNDTTKLLLLVEYQTGELRFVAAECISCRFVHC